MDIIDLGTASTETQGGDLMTIDNVFNPAHTKLEE
jgi:hypothetical protein